MALDLQLGYRMTSRDSVCQPLPLQAASAIANLPQLQYLLLDGCNVTAANIITLRLDMGCHKLERLTLQKVEGVSIKEAGVLMLLPCLRLLQLLRCPGSPGQEECSRLASKGHRVLGGGGGGEAGG